MIFFSPDLFKLFGVLLWCICLTQGFTQIQNASKMDQKLAGKPVGVLELRNYVTKPGQRDAFIKFFENNFTDAQSKQGGYVLGMFSVKDADDAFFWIRGYENMSSRSKYLPGFYNSDYWKQRRNTANNMLVNNDNVYLLKPLNFSEENKDAVISSNEFGRRKGLVVIDYYIANSRLQELIVFFKTKYISKLNSLDITDMTCWISELKENDFPALPVF